MCQLNNKSWQAKLLLKLKIKQFSRAKCKIRAFLKDSATLLQSPTRLNTKMDDSFLIFQWQVTPVHISVRQACEVTGGGTGRAAEGTQRAVATGLTLGDWVIAMAHGLGVSRGGGRSQGPGSSSPERDRGKWHSRGRSREHWARPTFNAGQHEDKKTLQMGCSQQTGWTAIGPL